MEQGLSPPSLPFSSMEMLVVEIREIEELFHIFEALDASDVGVNFDASRLPVVFVKEKLPEEESSFLLLSSCNDSDVFSF
mmetsp:Transcript_6283/g.9204  ORF Transcript_6283/g.9204 Transcript_6283/m.9204 type:complete len:80 (+) Transcript_6283:297-536(+)